MISRSFKFYWLLSGLGLLCSTGITPAFAQPASRPIPSVAITRGPSLPFGRGSAAAGLVDGKVVVAGGSSWSADRSTKTFLRDTVIFEQGKWVAGPPLPQPMAEGMFACDGGALYVAGGLKGENAASDAVFRLVREDGKWTWQTLASLPRPIVGGAAAIVNGTLYIACGQVDGRPSNNLYALDLSSAHSRWVQLASLAAPPRAYPAMATRGDALYLLGGCRMATADAKMMVYDDMWTYHPDSNQWLRLHDLPAAGYCWSADVLDAQRLIVTGRADGLIHDEVWAVDAQKSCVRSLGHDVSPDTCAPLVRVSKDTWWMIGGEPDSNKTRTAKVTVIHKTEPAR